MSADPGLIELAAESIAPLGPPSHRAMMGGATLYCAGLAYAIVADDALWFKADASSDAEWDAAGAERFTYARKDGTSASMNYRRAPDDCYDDPDAFRRWATLALEASRRAAAKKVSPPLQGGEEFTPDPARRGRAVPRRAPWRRRSGRSPPA